MNCNDTQTILLAAPESPDPAVHEHLASCPECRRFAAWTQTLIQIPGPAPAAALDRAVCQMAHLRLAARRHRRQRRLGWLAAAAALVVLVGWLAVPGLLAPPRTALAGLPSSEDSIWADGELEAALEKVAEQVSVLTSAPPSSFREHAAPPSLEELDDDLLDLELRFYFERAVLGMIELPATG